MTATKEITVVYRVRRCLVCDRARMGAGVNGWPLSEDICPHCRRIHDAVAAIDAGATK